MSRLPVLLCVLLVASMSGCGPARPQLERMPRVRAAPELYITTSGTGPAVVLLHGLGGRRDAWNGLDVELARDHTVLAVDLPGHGGSRAWSELPTSEVVDFKAIGWHVAVALKSRNLRDVVVVGHSMGGSIAPWVYAAAPEHVRAIVVIDSFVKPFPFDRAGLERRMHAIRTDKQPALTAWFGHLAQDAAQAERVVAGAMKVDAAVLNLYLGQAAVRDARPLLEGRPVRVHLQASRILAGEPARTDAQILAAAGLGRIAGATVTVFRDAAHWIFLDQRDACLADLRRVIDGPDAR